MSIGVYGGSLRGYDVPTDPVALRELMLAVRFAVMTACGD